MARKKGVVVEFSDAQLEKALDKNEDLTDIRKYLADKEGNEPSALAVKLRILDLMVKTGKVFKLENLKTKQQKAPSPYVEYGTRGIFVATRFLIAMDITTGTKYEPVKDKRGILLKEVE